ncbi:DNA-processing protein DprA [candidate division KSB1 bacterium]|nr:DNA-processing protein DprA [candidate division KSB1 bacterium]
MPFNLEALISLHLVEGIGSVRLRALIARFGQPEAIFEASPDALATIDGIDLKLAQRIKMARNDQAAAAQLDRMHRTNTRIITFWDADYPENLKRIYDPPALLFVRGSIKPEDKFALAVVGTRVPSTYGRYCVEAFVRGLVEKGLVVVSGLARGIDTLAHATALRTGGRTLAVLGSGVDIVYPAENKKLFAEIIEKGAVISEFLMGTLPDAPNFPRRNRIVSGIALGVLVVEAGHKSGALITANLALEQNREVFSIPGNINSPKSMGCNHLIQEGAKLAVRVDDIFDELNPQLEHLLKRQKIEQKIIQVTDLERKVLDSLSHEALHIDKIAEINQLTISQILGILLTLELKELVQQMPGKYFIRK